ncbi:hypothetical protein TRIUR3_29973 [Triticum urartu]|uniref:Uncharacterized protein n=1 Tax=Triticum urartu TaxID=4572 RepID=M8A1Z2_TRIUA|nr:hypothetical protein TRIUR3_29973 [Triticum urartu]
MEKTNEFDALVQQERPSDESSKGRRGRHGICERFWFHIALDDLDGTQGAEVCSGNRYNQGWNFCMPEDSKGLVSKEEDSGDSHGKLAGNDSRGYTPGDGVPSDLICPWLLILLRY